MLKQSQKQFKNIIKIDNPTYTKHINIHSNKINVGLTLPKTKVFVLNASKIIQKRNKIKVNQGGR